MTNYDVVDAADAPGEERVILAGEALLVRMVFSMWC
jgi:hypothetical protein